MQKKHTLVNSQETVLFFRMPIFRFAQFFAQLNRSFFCVVLRSFFGGCTFLKVLFGYLGGSFLYSLSASDPVIF